MFEIFHNLIRKLHFANILLETNLKLGVAHRLLISVLRRQRQADLCLPMMTHWSIGNKKGSNTLNTNGHLVFFLPIESRAAEGSVSIFLVLPISVKN